MTKIIFAICFLVLLFFKPGYIKVSAQPLALSRVISQGNVAARYISYNQDEGKGSDDIYSFTQDTTPHYKLRIIPNISPAQRPGVHKLVLNNIYFDLDRSNIRADAAEELDKLAILLKQHPVLRIEISGYTDSRASSQYNITLSQRRAEAARDYLVGKGISTGRLTIKWYGKAHLVNQCADGISCTEADRQLNRRVEFKVLNYN